MNSREKGKRGERQWRDVLRGHGYTAQRGQQYAGSPESPDVVCADLPWIHFEVKLRERLDIYGAMEQARRECGGKVPVVAHRRSQWPWLITIEAEVFFRLLSGELPLERRGPQDDRTTDHGTRENGKAPHPGPLPVGRGEGKENPKAPHPGPLPIGWGEGEELGNGGREGQSRSDETFGRCCGLKSALREESGDVLENVPTQKEKRDALERVPTNKNEQQTEG